jgi:hypothetical protein
VDNHTLDLNKLQEMRIKQLLFEPYEITRRCDQDVKLPYKAMEKTGADKQWL